MIRAAGVLGERDSPYEVVNGVRVEKPLSTYENDSAGLLFALPDHDRDARPDVAFVSDRWPKSNGIPTSNAWPVIPDLAVEIVSPTDAYRGVSEKRLTYFEAGVRSVWVVDRGAEQVHVFSAPTAVRILARGSDLADDAVLPDFRLPVDHLFPPPDPTP